MKIAIYGYDSIIGKSVLEALEEQSLNIEELYPLSPLASEYDAVPFKGKNCQITYVDEFDFNKVDVALLLVTKDESERLIPRIKETNCIIVDNSHLFSADSKLPIIVNELNPYDIVKVKEKKFAIVPYSLTRQILMALTTVDEEHGLKRAVVNSLVPLSEHGELGTQTLARETALLLNGSGIDCVDFPAQVAFNIHTRIGQINEAGNSSFEQSVLDEVAHLTKEYSFEYSLNCIQVPVFYGLTSNIYVELEDDPSVEEFKQALVANECIKLEGEDEFVTPVSCAEMDAYIYVTRVRKVGNRRFDFSIVMDNTRQGEASSIVDLLTLLNK